MNNIRFRFSFLFLLTAVLLLNGCSDKVLRTFEANVPIYQSLEEWRQTDFKLESARELKRPGKIYIYGKYLFVNEYLTGVHFFDNSNPANPVNLGFMEVLANVDIAIRNNVMYLDSYSDLLSIDITEPTNPRYLSRVEDVFNFNGYGGLDSYDFNYPVASIDQAKGVVIGWKVEKVTEVTGNYNPWAFGFQEDLAVDVTNTGGAQNLNTIGLGGSTARFTIWENYLYTLQSWQLDVFDITGDPSHVAQLNLQNNCETLFPYDGKLFIGTTTGMLIYNLRNPASPTFISEFEHFRACDPVAVQGDRAYVTLRSGTNCWNNVDRLEVIDISDINNPRMMHWHRMTNPRGLGLDGDLLFICDGPDGLKVYDKTDPQQIPQNQLGHFPALEANDVIPNSGTLIMTSEAGIYQYDYSDPGNIIRLSHLPIVQ